MLDQQAGDLVAQRERALFCGLDLAYELDALDLQVVDPCVELLELEAERQACAFQRLELFLRGRQALAILLRPHGVIDLARVMLLCHFAQPPNRRTGWPSFARQT